MNLQKLAVACNLGAPFTVLQHHTSNTHTRPACAHTCAACAVPPPSTHTRAACATPHIKYSYTCSMCPYMCSMCSATTKYSYVCSMCNTTHQILIRVQHVPIHVQHVQCHYQVLKHVQHVPIHVQHVQHHTSNTHACAACAQTCAACAQTCAACAVPSPTTQKDALTFTIPCQVLTSGATHLHTHIHMVTCKRTHTDTHTHTAHIHEGATRMHRYLHTHTHTNIHTQTHRHRHRHTHTHKQDMHATPAGNSSRDGNHAVPLAAASEQNTSVGRGISGGIWGGGSWSGSGWRSGGLLGLLGATNRVIAEDVGWGREGWKGVACVCLCVCVNAREREILCREMLRLFWCYLLLKNRPFWPTRCD